MKRCSLTVSYTRGWVALPLIAPRVNQAEGRASTQQQGADGLGIEAQRQAVANYLNGGSWKMLKEFVEVESGKVNARPQLEQALQLAKVTNATLVIARLDRLSRNASFVLALRDAGVRFVAADMPEANDTVIGFMAVVAQSERASISDRTRKAMAVVKQEIVDKGFRMSKRSGRKITRLGNPNGAAVLRREGKGNVAAVRAIKAKADERARDLEPIVADIEQAGITSHRGIAAELNEREIPSPRGKQWNEIQVARLRQRLKQIATV